MVIENLSLGFQEGGNIVGWCLLKVRAKSADIKRGLAGICKKPVDLSCVNVIFENVRQTTGIAGDSYYDGSGVRVGRPENERVGFAAFGSQIPAYKYRRYAGNKGIARKRRRIIPLAFFV